MNRAQILARMGEILASDGTLSDDDVTEFEDLERQLEALDRSDDIRARAAAASGGAADGTPDGNGTDAGDDVTRGDADETGGRPSAADIVEALRGVTLHTPADVGAHQEADDLERAFTDWVRTGNDHPELVELRAQGQGTGSTGGYTVPVQMMARITERMKAFGGVAGAAETITTADGTVIPWATLDDADNSGQKTNEHSAPASGADLVFGKRELGAYRYSSVGTGGNPLRVSGELLMNSAVDIERLVGDKLAMRLARAQATAFVTGTGANEPQGIVDGATVGATAGINALRAVMLADDTAGLTHADLVTYEHSVDPDYRMLPGTVWAFNDNTLKTIKQMVDTNGDPLWTNAAGGVDMGEGLFRGSLMGYPVVIDQAFVDLDVDDNADFYGVFGNLREGFVVRRVADVTIIRDPFTRAAQNEVQFVAHGFVDSIQNNRDAYIVMTGEA